MKDYYKILEIEENATDDDIKKSYRALSKKYHPDVNPEGEEKFKEIAEAYEVLGNKTKRVLYFKNRIANFFLTLLVNLLTNLNFTDVETGYKAFKRDILKDIKLKENSFTFEIEFTMKIAKLKKKIYEVGISYNGRTVEEGKKIKLKDGFLALYCILKYRFFN